MYKEDCLPDDRVKDPRRAERLASSATSARLLRSFMARMCVLDEEETVAAIN